MALSLSPCKDCSDRAPVCWGGCERYIQFKANNDFIREQRNRMDAANTDFYGVRGRCKPEKPKER